MLPILCGEERVDGLDYGWRLLRSPLPTMASSNEPNARRLFRNLREELDMAPAAHLAGALSDLPLDLRDDLETEEETEDLDLELAIQTDAERAALASLITALEGMEGDPKLAAIRFYLKDEGWLALGCIIFSQYYDYHPRRLDRRPGNPGREDGPVHRGAPPSDRLRPALQQQHHAQRRGLA